MREWRINCTTEYLPHLDNDPNGDDNATCAKCRAKMAHDFDIEPDVEFDRAGNIIEKTGEWREVGKTLTGHTLYTHTLTETSFFFNPELGTFDNNGFTCAVRKDGTLSRDRVCSPTVVCDLSQPQGFILLMGKLISTSQTT